VVVTFDVRTSVAVVHLLDAEKAELQRAADSIVRAVHMFPALKERPFK
jgi:hypothetical protein